MHGPTKRDRAAVAVLGQWLVVVLDRGRVFVIGARTETAGHKECRDGGRTQNEPKREVIEKAGRPEHDRRRAHQRIAADTAKPGRQRPRPTMRPAAEKSGGRTRAQDPAAE